MVKKSNSHPVDVHVGARLRLRRVLRGMSQEDLGKHLGLSFQQVQKYERGANRVSASRLWQLAGVLEVPVSFFFDDMAAANDASSCADIEAVSLAEGRLLRDYRTLSPSAQDAIRTVVRASAGAADLIGGA